jgi:hypothetical protein
MNQNDTRFVCVWLVPMAPSPPASLVSVTKEVAAGEQQYWKNPGPRLILLKEKAREDN